jgi:hypothetical protein
MPEEARGWWQVRVGDTWLVSESMFNRGNEPLLRPKNGTYNVSVFT